MDPVPITRRGIVVPRPPDRSGASGPTPGQARGPRWRRVAPGQYVPVGTDSSSRDQRIVEALVGLPLDAAVTGWASLGWAGARWFDGLAADGRTPVDVPVALDRRRGARRRAGVELTEDWLLPHDVVRVDGLRTTIPERAVAFETCRARTLAAAEITVDMAVAADLVDLERLADYAAALGPRPGIRRFREALSRADENAWSPQESRMRLVWTHHRPGTVLSANRPVFDHAGRHLLTPDLLDERAGIVGEYDGAVHLDDTTRRRDLDREALCRDPRPRAGDDDVVEPPRRRRLHRPPRRGLPPRCGPAGVAPVVDHRAADVVGRHLDRCPPARVGRDRTRPLAAASRRVSPSYPT
ncbi:hypothetical protein [Nocardioides aestuarii]|uniref:AbiEi antitoxin C-terminal domain-containing protein n=1 Tax=Nocardioides aestuarii TaxID=252231 RepID=A0ABW4TRC0_9ACTN